ncbi:MAG: hypothetical protein B7Z42_16470, partial [Brevundimonas sp. 12-68-7]
MKLRLAAALALAPLPALAQTPAGQIPPAQVTEIGDHFAKYRDQNPTPGMIYVVIKDGKPALSAMVGTQTPGGAPVTLDTRFRIASMSKAFTALAIL